MSFGGTTPILRMFDETKAREFYVDYLGFKVDWENRFWDGAPLYMQVSKDGCTLHLSEHHGDCCPGAAVRIQTDELERYCEELKTKRNPVIKDMFWGGKDMDIRDPFGNRLIFTDGKSK